MRETSGEQTRKGPGDTEDEEELYVLHTREVGRHIIGDMGNCN